MPFGCIYVPDFPVAAIVRAEPELRFRAVAVLKGKPPLEKIIAVNDEARAVSITPGMTQLQVELCEAVVLRDRSPLQEAAAHAALLDCAQSFSPNVEDVALDTVLFDLAGSEKLFGPPQKIVREMFHVTKEMGLAANVAVACTLEAALLAARGFSGTTVIPEGKEAEFLGGLRVDVLFADENDPQKAEEFLQTFRRWGIRKFRALSALPEIELSERLGQHGLELQRKARGESNRTLVPSDPPLIFEEAIDLEYPLVLLEPLAFVLNRMLEQLCARLQARALAAQELHLELTLENSFPESVAPPLPCSVRQGGIFKRNIHFPLPLLNPKIFLKLLQLDLKSHPPGAPVTKIHLRIEPAKPRSAQDGLFQPSSPEPEKLELTLARISSVVGEGRAGSPELLNTHRREAFEMQHFTPSAHKNGNGSKRNAVAPNGSASTELVTALRIFRPLVAVNVHHQNGRPSHISAIKPKEISGEVLWAAGPWRSSGDWWEHDSWMRDEWDIALREQQGIALYRLVHDLIEGKWMVEGTYD